ncbi:MAG: hypothetical protein IPO21_09195 [Bacteroidales bacterium]|nr:hypothetical protein [Bacteroidales bacterium]
MVALHWQPDLRNTRKEYELKYRRFASVDAWTILRFPAPQDSFLLDHTMIAPDEVYEYTLAGKCKSWQETVYGGTFKVNLPDCKAPQQIEIASNTETEVKLNWEQQEQVLSYNVYASKTADAKAATAQNVSSNSIVLQPLADGESYTIQIEALCSDNTAIGKPVSVNRNQTGIIAECALPKPYSLAVERKSGTATQANVSWLPEVSKQYSHYTFSFWHKDSINQKYTVEAKVPSAIIKPVIDRELYVYTVTYHCNETEAVQSAEKYFKLDPQSSSDPGILPGTANCFPPSEIFAEARSNTSAIFDWIKAEGADEYQLFYAPKGSTDFKVFNTTAVNAKIKDLTHLSGQYDYKVRCRCGSEYSIFSSLGSVSLLSDDKENACADLAFAKVNKVTYTEVQLAWAAKPHDGYMIYYKEESQSWSDKYTIDLKDKTKLKAENLSANGDTIKYTVIQLASGASYQFRIVGACGTTLSLQSEVLTATTDKKFEKGDCESGSFCDRSSKVPLAATSITKDSVILFADYKMKIVSVKSSVVGDSTVYSGTGIVEAPLVGMSEFLCLNATFTNLFINDKHCITKGDIVLDSVNTYLLPEEVRAGIKQFTNIVETGLDRAQEISKDIQLGLEQAEKLGKNGLDYFQGGNDVGQAVTGSLSPQATFTTDLTTENFAVTGFEISAGGETKTVSTFPALVKDSEGEVYQVQADGSTTLVGKYDETYKNLHTKTPDQSSMSVTFKENSTATYGFDPFQEKYGEQPAMRIKYLKLGNDYFSAKAITEAATDKVDFTLTSTTLSDIVFVNREGFVFNASGNTLTLVGGPEKDAQEILAVTKSDKTVIGALLLASYPKIEKKVKIIPADVSITITAQDLAKMQTKVNEVYNKVGINYTLEIDNSIQGKWCGADQCEAVAPSRSGLLSNNYTGTEEEIIQYYASQKSFNTDDAETAYMILTGASADTQSDEGEMQGRMNYGKQFGFLYGIGNSNDYTKIGHTLAHELGHGNFKLYHIFDEMYLGNEAKTADNIMSYSTSATKLNKMQWDIVHDPGVVWGVLAKDGDQAKRVDLVENLNYNNFGGYEAILNYLLSKKDELIPLIYGKNAFDYFGKNRDLKYKISVAKSIVEGQLNNSYFLDPQEPVSLIEDFNRILMLQILSDNYAEILKLFDNNPSDFPKHEFIELVIKFLNYGDPACTMLEGFYDIYMNIWGVHKKLGNSGFHNFKNALLLNKGVTLTEKGVITLLDNLS